MLNNIDLKSVELFLKTAKKQIQKGNRYFILNRKVCYDGKKIAAREALYDLGIVKIDKIWEYILNLSPNECINISRDYDLKRDNNDDMYEFITFINNVKVYIKLTINNRGTVCLSFHKSDR